MKATIDFDVGGTFTDCFVTINGKVATGKSPTTPLELGVGCIKAIANTAESVGMSLDQLVKSTTIIRHSTTIATNLLINRAGPKLGLITTEGFEDVMLIGEGSRWVDGLTTSEIRNLASADKPEPLIPRDLTVGVKERIDSNGEVLRPLDEDDVVDKVNYLINRGVQGIVVSLLWAHLNPEHERKVREIIEKEYPWAYLGSRMLVMLSSDICPKRWEYPRTVTTMINAYLHEVVQEELFDLVEELQNHGYKKVPMIIHNSGGMGEVLRTSAIQTWNGGPTAGLIGGAHLGKILGYDNVVLSDVGGTSFDLGMVVAGSSRFYRWNPVIDRWRVDITMLETSSIGAGGGSIAWLNPALGNRLEVGPRSAGSMPGPVCYEQGGTEPTVTDADVVLGYINPGYFHGGRMKLNRDKSISAIRDKIARPLGLEVEQGALLIKRIVDANMSNVISREVSLRGYDPREFVIFAFGGGGATHCCGYGFQAGIGKLVTFPFSAVFCAYGAANMDISHIYEKSKRLSLLAPGGKQYFTEYGEFNDVIQALQEQALRDITGEGFSGKDVIFSLELDMQYGGQINLHRVASPRVMIKSEADARAVYEEFEREYAEVYSSFAAYPEGGADIQNFILRATVPQPKVQLPTYAIKGGKPPKQALKGRREAYWEEYEDFRSTPIYEQKFLESGNRIEGPAIIESDQTTTVLPPGTNLAVDKYRNLLMERA